jgi:hypothetical protein
MSNFLKTIKSHRNIFFFNITYLVFAALYFLTQKNFEFLWYLVVLFFLFFLIILTLEHTHFDHLILWGFSIWGLLHLLGGGLVIKDNVLYGLILLPLFEMQNEWVLKYDQVVHFYGFGVATLACAVLLSSKLRVQKLTTQLKFLIVCMGMGLGALNEVIEFLAVIFIPETNVGGYVNTSLDLISNALGSCCALIFVPRYFNTALSVKVNQNA